MEYDDNNIFAKIIRKELDAKIVFEDDRILAFHDIYPQAPMHVLVIPKGKYVSFDDFIAKAKEEDILYFFKSIKEIAIKLGLNSYRILSNHGVNADQTVMHFHMHIMGNFVR